VREVDHSPAKVTNEWSYTATPRIRLQGLERESVTFTLTVETIFLYTWVRASCIEFNNFPTRYELFSLLHYCRQLYIPTVLYT